MNNGTRIILKGTLSCKLIKGAFRKVDVELVPREEEPGNILAHPSLSLSLHLF